MIKFNQELYNRCYEKASQCSTCLEFSQKYGVEFYHSFKNNFIEKFTWLKNPKIYQWTKEAIFESCKGYENFNEWRKNEQGCVDAAYKFNITNELPLKKLLHKNFYENPIYETVLKYIDREASENKLGYKLEEIKDNDTKVICIAPNGVKFEYDFFLLFRCVQSRGCAEFTKVLIPGYNDTYTLYPQIRKFEDRETNLKNGIDLSKIKPNTHNIKINIFVDKFSVQFELCDIISHIKKNQDYDPKNTTRLITGYNDLKTLCPEFVEKYWDYERNAEIGLFPDKIRKYSNKKIFFKCGICGKQVKEKRSLNSMTDNKTVSMCRDCHNRLQTSFPEQTIYYYLKKLIPDLKNRYKVNGKELDIYSETYKIGIEYDGFGWHDNSKVLKKDSEKYNLVKNEIPDVRFVRIIDKMKERDVIPSCDFSYDFNDDWMDDKMLVELFTNMFNDMKLNLKVDDMDIDLERDYYVILDTLKKCLRENSFGTHFPEYVKYWDYEKNGDISPFEISYGSNHAFWFKFEWNGKVYSYKKRLNCLASGNKIYPNEVINKIKNNGQKVCISYEIDNASVVEYPSLADMKIKLHRCLERTVKGSNNHFTIDGKYLVFFKSDYNEENVKKMLDLGPVQIKTR